MKEKQDEPLFDVREIGQVKMFEAAKGVDWMSLFPDEPGGGPAKLIDLPAQPASVPPPPEPVLLRNLPPPPPPTADAPAGRAVKVLYPPGRARTPRAAIAASITTVCGTIAFLYWLVSPPVVQSSPGLSGPPPAVTADRLTADRLTADRLTMDALAPAAEPSPSPSSSPSPAVPVASALPEATPIPAGGSTRPNARTGDSARSRKTSAAASAPKPAPRKPSPTPTPRATPAITTRTTPTASPIPSPSAAAARPPATQPTLVSSPSPSPLPSPPPSPLPSASPAPITVGAPPPRAAATPQPSSTPLPTPSATPAASAATTVAAERTAVRAVLDRYRAAFESLRSESVQAVWAGANTRALARAFEQLQSQTVDFYSCGIELAAAGAEATCSGSVTFVPKVGGKTPRVESRQWTFYLKRQNERWMIDRVVSR